MHLFYCYVCYILLYTLFSETKALYEFNKKSDYDDMNKHIFC